MAKGRGDFTEILLKKQVLSSDQLAEARTMAQQSGAKLQDALVKLGYTPGQAAEAVARSAKEFSGAPTEVLLRESLRGMAR